MTEVKMSKDVEFVVEFPASELRFKFSITKIARELTTARIVRLLQCDGRLEDDEAVEDLLSMVDDEVLRATRAEDSAICNRLSARLRDHRGYGLEGDEAPAILFSVVALVDWLAVHRRADLDESGVILR